MDPAIGIVAALPVEAAAIRLQIDDLADAAPVPGDFGIYRCGTIPSRLSAQPHNIVTTLQTNDGTRDAAAVAAAMARSFPGLRAIILCGIAGGMPDVERPERHVRLGDIVVATHGIVDYGHVRREQGKAPKLRRSLGGMSPRLLSADHEMQTAQLSEAADWYSNAMGRSPIPRVFQRPPAGTDVLTRAGVQIAHPFRKDLSRPVVHRGLIGSADVLLKDEELRDELAREHSLLAVEMEGSGVAVGAALSGVAWFVVRGIADYCSETKNDVWHGYAAWVAAAYVRALLAHCPPLDVDSRRADHPAPTPTRSPKNEAQRLAGEHLDAVVDALAELSVMRDDYQRRMVLEQLPARLRTSISDSPHGRLHLIAVVQACDEFGARDDLLRALRRVLGDSPAFDRLRTVCDANWAA